jgi:hypothetical protein
MAPITGFFTNQMHTSTWESRLKNGVGTKFSCLKCQENQNYIKIIYYLKGVFATTPKNEPKMRQNLKWRILQIGILMYLESNMHWWSYNQINFEEGLTTFISQPFKLSPSRKIKKFIFLYTKIQFYFLYICTKLLFLALRYQSTKLCRWFKQNLKKNFTNYFNAYRFRDGCHFST